MKISERRREGGVHVRTTVSLSAGNVNEKYDHEGRKPARGNMTQLQSDDGLGRFRADRNNGFSTDIVGGNLSEEVSLLQ